MKKKLLFKAFNMLILGIRITLIEKMMSRIIDFRTHRNLPLTNKWILKLESQREHLTFIWDKYEKEFLYYSNMIHLKKVL